MGNCPKLLKRAYFLCFYKLCSFFSFFLFLKKQYSMLCFVNAHMRCRTTSWQPKTKQQNKINRKVIELWNNVQIKEALP